MSASIHAAITNKMVAKRKIDTNFIISTLYLNSCSLLEFNFKMLMQRRLSKPIVAKSKNAITSIIPCGIIPVNTGLSPWFLIIANEKAPKKPHYTPNILY